MLGIIGCVAAAAFAAWLVWLGSRPTLRPLPAYGWWGLAALATLEAMLALGIPGVVTFFTALVWTAYIPLVDAAVYRRRGDSLLHHPAAFTAVALVSIPAWLIFEAYNLHLRNWAYVGVPRQFWLFTLGGVWAFATILPGIFETADLFHCAWTARIGWPPRQLKRGNWMALGVVLLLVPLVASRQVAAYFFALVWVGFILLLDPLNDAWGWPSLWADMRVGRPGRLLALLFSGAACGFFWEFWNYWAQARWEYIFPIFHRYRIFAMPFPGFVGFPPFALECFALYSFLAWALLPRRLRVGLMEGGYASLNPQEDMECPSARK